MKKTRSSTLVFDCTNVYHNEKVYNKLKAHGIEPYPSAGHTHRVKGGYPPNSHETMPNEGFNYDFKELVRKNFNALDKNRKNMNSFYNTIKKTAAKCPKSLAIAHIKKLPHMMAAIIEKNGKRTKY